MSAKHYGRHPDRLQDDDETRIVDVDHTRRQSTSPGRNFRDLNISGSEPLSNGDLDPKGKGKSRALELNGQANEMEVDVAISTPAVQDSLSSSNGIGSHLALPAGGTTKPIRERERERVRGGRSRTLLESVQSHLSLPRARHLNGLAETAQQKSSLTPPSLLTRLSAPQTLLDTSSAEPSISDEIGTGTARGMTENPQSMSAPEIMKRTRARLAKLKNETIAGIPPSTPTPPLTPSITSPPVDLLAPLRSTLLEKLQAEKEKAGEAPSEPLTPTNEVPEDADPTENEALQAESKLRKQAQLRVRLAAAKRESATEESQREDALRAKLRSNRLVVEQ